MSKELICNECGRKLNEVTMFEFDETILCQECFERLTAICSCCSERIWLDNAEGDSYITLCDSCYSCNYTRCYDCGRLIHNDNAYYEDDSDYPYCHECYERNTRNVIKQYSYKPEPIFYGDSNIYYGIELEIDNGGEDNTNAQNLLDYVNQDNDYIYAKHDGSLTDGFELVSHPMTLDYHLSETDWSGLFNRAIDMGYRSHQTKTCGLHCHVSK